MRTTYQDLRYALRVFLGSPAFTAVAVLTLALGIAVNTTVFSWIDGLLLRPFPGSGDSHELAVLEMVTAGAPNGANQTSYIDYKDYRQSLTTLSGLAVHHTEVFSLGEPANVQPVWGELISADYFDVLRVTPAFGRTFTPEEGGDQLGAYPVAVISHRLWQSRFRGDPSAAGKTLRVNQHLLTVVGVAPPEFRGTMPGLFFDIWVPVTMGTRLGMLDAGAFSSRSFRAFYAVARLRPGVSIEQARAEAAAFSHNLESAYPKTNRGITATVLPVWEFHSAAPELLLKPLRVLMAISALVLLIVCANVANLLLARAVVRRKELSIRLALGAGGVRIARQILTETFVLAAGGAVVGFLMTNWLADLLPLLVPKIGASLALGFHPSPRVMGFTILACAAATIVSGGAPAYFWLRSDVNAALKQTSRGGSQSAQSNTTRGLLVAAEVALATVALIGAGLFVRSFHNARGIDPGFDRNNVLLARFYLSGSGFDTRQTHQFCDRLRERLSAVPGVAAVTFANYAPLGTSSGPYSRVEPEGYVHADGESKNVNDYKIAPGYFGTLRIPILEGRDFSLSDDWGTEPVLIVNESFARRYFQGASPVGRRVRYRGQWNRVVGMARDSKYFSVVEAPRPHFFVPYRQRAGADEQLYFFVKAAGDPRPVMTAFRREVASVDPNAAAYDLMPLEEWTLVTLFPQKVAASFLAALGVVALILAAVGLYSVMAYAVSQRTQEIGIRMALGARPGNILADVLARGLALTGAGLAAGLALAFAFTRLVGSMLVQIAPADPATFLGASLFLAGVALFASFLPAYRAIRNEPLRALRCE